jgi:hypothetical protein
LPLGDSFHGVCRARYGDFFAVDEPAQRELCNCGYARGRCERFPAESAGDAVRFSLLDDAGSHLRLVYMIEKDYAPIEHGPLEYAVAEKEFIRGNASEVLATQAQAFVESYLRRRLPRA